nr:hypothetical protein [Tanacetum cinerariifolium]
MGVSTVSVSNLSAGGFVEVAVGFEFPLLSGTSVLRPLPAAVSPTAKSSRYIADSEPEIDPEEEDRDNEKSKGDSIEYLTSRGDDDADDDGDDFSEDDADDEDEEESSTSKYK